MTTPTVLVKRHAARAMALSTGYLLEKLLAGQPQADTPTELKQIHL